MFSVAGTLNLRERTAMDKPEMVNWGQIIKIFIPGYHWVILVQLKDSNKWTIKNNGSICTASENSTVFTNCLKRTLSVTHRAKHMSHILSSK